MASNVAYKNRGSQVKVSKRSKLPPITKIHVISHRPNWSIVAEGRIKSFRSSLSKSEAIALARKLATRLSADFVVIHDRNGEVTKRIAVQK